MIATPQPRRTAAVDESSSTESARVLLVHRDPEFQDSLAQTFTKLGHQIVTTQSGAAAMILCAATRIDMIFIDEELRDVTCEHFLEYLQLTAQSIPAVVVTDQQDPENSQRLIRAGALDVITFDDSLKQLTGVCERAGKPVPSRGKRSA